MESRNVTLTLDKAKEFYNSGNSALKEIALQSFTKAELNVLEWKNIKTFTDACHALNLFETSVVSDLNTLKGRYFEGKTSEHLVAIYKLDIIRKALNGDWEPNLIKECIYYPFVKIYPAGKEAKEAAAKNNWKLGESFIANGKKYTLVGGEYCSSSYDGLTSFGYGHGGVMSYLGLYGCKSKEIAKHLSRYFSKEIFEATYANHVGVYQWV